MSQLEAARAELAELAVSLERQALVDTRSVALSYRELSSSQDLVSLDIANDGIPSVARKSSDGSGIGNLTTRVRALGGDLRAGPVSGQTYRLHAEIPLPLRASR